MPSNRLHVFRLNARELLREPGLERHIALALPAAEVGVDDDRVVDDLDVDLHVVSTIDGVTVSGRVRVPWRSACRRCLADATGTTDITIDEVYRTDGDGDLDTFEIVGDQIDLVPAIRENVLLELPADPLCRDDCAGICPVCGGDRNAAGCECDTTVRDERWAALDQLEFDDE